MGDGIWSTYKQTVLSKQTYTSTGYTQNTTRVLMARTIRGLGRRCLLNSTNLSARTTALLQSLSLRCCDKRYDPLALVSSIGRMDRSTWRLGLSGRPI